MPWILSFPATQVSFDISWYEMPCRNRNYSGIKDKRKAAEKVEKCYEKNMLIDSVHITKLVFLSCCFLSFHFQHKPLM